MTIRALVVGAAAGGGLPQWNCNGRNSASFWRGGAPLKAATQSSLAVSSDGVDWALLNASPDIRSQIMARPELQPRDPGVYGLRDTPICSVLLTNGDIDHIAGLLTLRERTPFRLFATQGILDVLAANPVFDALASDVVTREAIRLDTPFDLLPGLEAELFAVPGKVPLFLEGDQVETEVMGEQTVGVRLTGNGKTAYYIPGCARVTDDLRARLSDADLLFFDGTLWADDEMIRSGTGQKTGRRMGHISMSGPDGAMAALADLEAQKVFIHINNTNPVLQPGGQEAAEVAAKGWQVAFDGMELSA